MSAHYDRSTALPLTLLQDAIGQSGLPFRRGIEKEGLRVDAQGFISQSDHPQALGHPLTHSHITTDYSEALLELITGVHRERSELLGELRNIHTFVQQHLQDELLWSGSMPCRLDGDASIRIAEYGESNIGQLKHVYRQGLGVRYGRVMQSIAGMHFNFSLSENFWDTWAEHVQPSSLQEFRSRRYFALIRNFRRRSWLLMYLFGASPALDSSFVKGKTHALQTLNGPDTLYLPYATSLRMGDLGYHNNAQASLAICFNTLENFIATLQRAMRTPWAPYVDIGMQRGDQYIQLSTAILQIENEYYSSIRPKRPTGRYEHPSQALSARGVEYVEVRCLDLNPFYDIGTCDTDIDFLDLFLTQCLLDESPYIADCECTEINNNFSITVNQGRQPGLILQRDGNAITLNEWATEIIESLAPLAKTLDQHVPDQRYEKALARQLDKVRYPNLTPSGHLLQVLETEGLSWLECAQSLSEKHQFNLRRQAQQADFASYSAALQEQALNSFAEEAQIRQQDTLCFSEFLAQYMHAV